MKSVIDSDCVALLDQGQSKDFTLISRNALITLGLFQNKKVQDGNVKCGLKTVMNKKSKYILIRTHSFKYTKTQYTKTTLKEYM